MIKLGFSLSVMAIGLIVVFFGLAILIFAIIIASKMIESATKKNEKPAAVTEPPKPAIAPVAKVEQPERDPRLVAIITAAVMAMDGTKTNLVVRSIKRADAWSRAGRTEILGSR